jgi:hypothetical protein
MSNKSENDTQVRIELTSYRLRQGRAYAARGFSRAGNGRPVRAIDGEIFEVLERRQVRARSPQQLRQLGDVGGDPPRLVAGEQFARRPPSGLISQ